LYTNIWLGATDLASDGSWIWQTSGNSVNYTKFNSGQPNGGTTENCLAMTSENGNWSDLMCTYTFSYHVCEIPTSEPAPKIYYSKKQFRF